MLTVTVGFGPLFVFIDEVKGRHGQLLSVVAFFVLQVWLASLVGTRLPEGLPVSSVRAPGAPV